MVVILENEVATAVIKEFGAELCSFIIKKTGIQYIWYGDGKYWNRHAPVLFPIVGSLKDKKYNCCNKTFEMGQHGIARDMPFEVITKEKTKAVFELKSDDKTKEKYPFEFIFHIIYTLEATNLKIEYYVKNTDNQTIYFGVGGHPAFNTPLTQDITFDDYYVDVSEKQLERIPLIGGLSDPKNQKMTESKIKVSRESFKDDAIIYDLKGKNTILTLKTDKNEHGVTLETVDAPFVGVWSPYPKNALFVCLEPWWGLADNVDTNQDYTTKFGINKLEEKKEWSKYYVLKFF